MDFHDYVNTRKLTNEYLFGLRTGRFLVRSVCDHHYRPAFAEVVSPSRERLQQWERIKAAGANGRLSDLFKDRSAFQLHAAQAIKRQTPRLYALRILVPVGGSWPITRPGPVNPVSRNLARLQAV